MSINIHRMRGSQISAARGFLGLSRENLARKVGVTAETIKNIERGIHSMSDNTRPLLQQFFSDEGVAFFELPGGGMGVILDRTRSKDALAVQNKALSPSFMKRGD